MTQRAHRAPHAVARPRAHAAAEGVDHHLLGVDLLGRRAHALGRQRLRRPLELADHATAALGEVGTQLALEHKPESNGCKDRRHDQCPDGDREGAGLGAGEQPRTAEAESAERERGRGRALTGAAALTVEAFRSLSALGWDSPLHITGSAGLNRGYATSFSRPRLRRSTTREVCVVNEFSYC